MKGKLRVLIINSAKLWGGVEKWMMEVGSGLLERGHLVLTVGRPGSLWLQIATSRGMRAVPLRMRSDFDPLMSFKLFRLMRKERIDVLCTNFDKELRLAGPAAKMIGVAVIARKGLPAIKDRWRYRLVYRFLVDKIVIPTHSIKRIFSKYNWLDQSLVTVIHNGVELDHSFPPNERQRVKEGLGLNPSGPIVGIVASMNTLNKGQGVLIRAAGEIVREFPGVRLILVGDGQKRPFFQGLVKELGLEGNFVFTGFRTDVPRILQAIDIFVLPSLFSEGLPNALLEAMAAAKPVVTTPVGGIPEVMVDGETGLLVPPGDVEALTEALLRLLRDPERAYRMGEAGRRWVQERFSREKMVEEVERLFEETLAQR